MLIPTAKDREDAIHQIDLTIWHELYKDEDAFDPENLPDLIKTIWDFVMWRGIQRPLDKDYKERNQKDDELRNEIKAALPSDALREKLETLINLQTEVRLAEIKILMLAGLMTGLRVAENLMPIDEHPSKIDAIIEDLKAGKVSRACLP